jgi:hypothetical protein
MKCCTVSSPSWHAGQVGESAFPMRCKCLARGVCPVLSCDSMLASFLSRVVMRLMYLFDGAVGSVLFIFV